MIKLSQLLLEYNAEKTWKNHGENVKKRAHHEYHNLSHDHDVLNKTFSKDHQTPESEHKAAEKHLFPHIEETDPTPKKKYVQHIARIYGKGGVNHIEDLHSRMRPALAAYHDLNTRNQLAPEDRDIGRVKHLTDLEDIVAKHEDTKSGRDLDREHHEKMKSEATITDHPDFTHIVPHTRAAAEHFGKGTRWCTSATNHNFFRNYNDKGPLQIMVPKKPNYPGEKYQYHYSTGSFMNEKDIPASRLDSNMHPGIIDHISDYEREAHQASLSSAGLDHPENKVRVDSLRNASDISSDKMTEMLKNNKHSYDIVSNILSNPNHTQDHMYQVLNDKDSYLRSVAFTSHHSSSLSTMQLDKILNDHLDSATTNSVNHGLVRQVLMHQNSVPAHTNKLLEKSDSPDIASLLIHSSKFLTKDHIAQFIKHKDSNVANDAMRSSLYDPREHGEIALKSPHVSVFGRALQDIDDDTEKTKIIKDTLSKGKKEKALYLLDHVGPAQEHALHGLEHKNPAVVYAAAARTSAMNQNDSDGVLERHHNPAVRAIAAKGTTIPDKIDRLLSDPKPEVRWAALSNPNVQKEHLDKGANDPHPEVRLRVAHHENASEDTLKKLSHDRDERVSMTASHHSALEDKVHRPKTGNPEAPARQTVRSAERTPNYAMTHVPGDKVSETKLKAVKSYIRMHNKTSPKKIEMSKRGRFGVGRYKQGKENRPHGADYASQSEASRSDVYIHTRYDRHYEQDVKKRHPVFKEEVAVNNAGSGAIQGIGTGPHPQSEPGVKKKKKLKVIMKDMLRRSNPK